MAESGKREMGWLVCGPAGIAFVVCALWGYDSHVCPSIGDALSWTIFESAMSIFIPMFLFLGVSLAMIIAFTLRGMSAQGGRAHGSGSYRWRCRRLHFFSLTRSRAR